MARRRRRQLSFFEKMNLNPDINRGLLAIFLFIAGALAALSFFGLAGVAGHFIDALLAIAFGQVRYTFPIILLLVAVLMIKDMDYNYQPTHWLGAILFFLSFNALVHLHNPTEIMWDMAVQGYGGGLIGFLLAWPFASYIGYWGGLIILIGLTLIAIIFLFNTSLAKIVDLHRRLFSTLGWIGQKMIKLFGFFKIDQDKTKFKIKGQYSVDDSAQENESNNDNDKEDDQEETARFKKKLLKQEERDQEEDDYEKKEEENEDEEEEKTFYKKPNIIIRDLPSLDLLYISKSKPTAGDIKANAQTIKETLFNFGIDVTMGEVRIGPTVAQYALKPAKGVKLTRITALNNDLALSLASHPIRIEAPIPGKSLVGVEVPNQTKAIVGLRAILESKEFKVRKSNLTISLGKDVSGKPWVYDITKMPHLLVAGATNSGKSVCLNAVIVSLLYQNNPDDLRFIMVDPKRVELPVYNGIPHLLTPVITEVDKTINALKWCLNEMDRRFDVLARSKKRNIQAYNSSNGEKMPYLVFVIDELADLMVVAARDVETAVIRLAQMARAVGIHLVLATQRPSVDVITGLIKANMPARIAFSVASSVDSRTILDALGAEKLLGSGDMLFSAPELSKPKRIQGAYVSDQEIKRIIRYIKEKSGEPNYVEGVTDRQRVKGLAGVGMSGDGADDELFEEAKEVVVNMGKASTSLLQRRLSVGYARAAKLVDHLEDAGIVGPANGSKPREILISKEQYHSRGAKPAAGVPLHNRDEAVAPDSYLDDDETTGVPPVFRSEEEIEEEFDDQDEETAEGQEEAAEEKDSEEVNGDEEEVLEFKKKNIDEEVSDEGIDDGGEEVNKDEEEDGEPGEDAKEEDDDDGIYFSR